MKIQIDTENKVIRLLEEVQIGSLIDTLKKLFPNKEWKSFSIDFNSTVTWIDPIYIPLRYDPPIYPWYQPYQITTSTSGYVDTDMKPGVYNVETTALAEG